MLPNSSNLICGNSRSLFQPFSAQLHLELVPFSFLRLTDTRFLYFDIKDHMTTNILSLSFNKEGKTQTAILQEFMGVYEQCCFGDDRAFLINKEGDILYYDFVEKDSFFVQKQHPFLYSPLQIHSISEYFVTCGGSVKTGLEENQKIIKVWHQQDDELVCQARIVTGHSKDIENSVILGENRVVTLSTDKTMRVMNLTTQQMEQIIKVKADYFTGCQLDWNTLLVGGQGQHLDIFDVRSKRVIGAVRLSLPVVQICEMVRMSSDMVLFANVNEMYSLDTRMWQILQKGRFEGERISKIMPISNDTLIIGNRDRRLQLWRCL